MFTYVVCYSPYQRFRHFRSIRICIVHSLPASFSLEIFLQLDCLIFKGLLLTKTMTRPSLHDIVHCDLNKTAYMLNKACFCDCETHYPNSSHSLSAEWLDAAEVSYLITGEVS